MNTLQNVGRGHEREPLPEYLRFMGTFAAASAVGTAVLRLAGKTSPGRMPPSDLLLLGLATTRIARLVTRDKVTRAVRAPFTEVEPGAKPHEVKEHARTDAGGFTRAVGELLTCPRCVAVWAAAGLTMAYVAAPGATRVAGSILAAALIADIANVGIGKMTAAT